MGYFIFRRSIQSLFSLVALVILVFFLSRLTGSPADLYLPQDATEEMRQQFDMQHGFDQPLYVQFGTFLIGLLHFDLGQSIQFSRPAVDVVLQAFPTTLMLAAVAHRAGAGGGAGDREEVDELAAVDPTAVDHRLVLNGGDDRRATANGQKRQRNEDQDKRDEGVVAHGLRPGARRGRR